MILRAQAARKALYTLAVKPEWKGLTTRAMDGLQERKGVLRKAVRAQLAKLSADEIDHQCLSIPRGRWRD